MSGASEGNQPRDQQGRYDLARTLDRERVRLRNLAVIGLLVCFVASTMVGYVLAGQLDRTQWVQTTWTMAETTTTLGQGSAWAPCPLGTRVVSGGFTIGNVTEGYTSVDLLRITGSAPFTESAPFAPGAQGWVASWWWGSSLSDLRTLGLEITVSAECQG